MKRLSLAVAVAAVAVTSAVPAFAVISAADQTSILAGISASDTLFYALGGGLLVVMAGIWGFKRVRAMF